MNILKQLFFKRFGGIELLKETELSEKDIQELQIQSEGVKKLKSFSRRIKSILLFQRRDNVDKAKTH